MDKKISQLTAATTPLTGAEELAIVQSGVTKKTTIEDVKGYKVYTALLTQSGGDDIQSKYYPDTLSIGVTYIIMDSNDNTCDFTNVGAPNNIEGTSFVATGTTPNSWGSTNGAILNYNTGAPVVTVLENTIGNIWFTYNSDGTYEINSDGLFPISKTVQFINNITVEEGCLTIANWVDGNKMYLTSKDGGFTGVNGYFINTPIEIRVYN